MRSKAWVGPVLAGTLVPLLAVLLSGHTLEWRDTSRIHAPLRGLVVDALRDLRLPLWNPHEACGSPLFAQLVHGVLHPVSLAAAFIAPRAGPDLQIVAHVLLAALGAGLLVRRLGGTPHAATAAGLAYGLSGYVLSMATVLHYLAAAATAPWVVAALREASAGRRRFVAAGLAVAVAHFTGDPQWALVATVTGAALALERGGRRGLAFACGAAVAGTALAGVQLAPAWDLLRESIRGTEALEASERTLWSFAPVRALEFAAPGFFSGRPGQLVAPVFVALGGAPREPGAFLPTYTLPFVISVFIGAPVLILAAAGTVASRAGKVLAGIAAVLLWLALGEHLGARQLLGAVPIWGAFRYAEKLVGPLTLVVATLAGLGVDRLAGAPPPWARPVAFGSSALAGTAVVALASGLGGSAPWRLPLAWGLAHALVSAGALAVLLHVFRRRASGRAAFPALLAALVFVQSAAASPFALHVGTPGMRDPAPLAELRTSAEVVRVGTPLRGVSRWRPPALDPQDGMLAFESRLGVAPFPSASGIDQIDTYTALVPRQLAVVNSVLGENRDPGFWERRRRYGLTHVVLREPLGPREQARADAAAASGTVVRRDAERHLTVYAVPHRPWAAFVSGAVPATGSDAVEIALSSVASTSWDTVVLEGEMPAGFAPGRVLSIRRAPERVRIEADAQGPALLVVNDTYAGGWEATLDGSRVPILRADGYVRAIAWPAGRHALEMRYRPRSVRVGLWVSGFGVLLLAAGGMLRKD